MSVGADTHLVAGGALEDLPRAEPPAPHCTDLGNSERFVRQYGADVRYCYLWKTYFEWADTHWRRDLGAGVAERAKLTARALYQEAAATEDPDRRKALSRWAGETESERRQRAMLALARSALAIAPDVLDCKPRLLNVANGTLDLTTFELRDHRRDDFITKLCPTSYDPTATCPRFLAFLLDAFNGDRELIAWLQKLLGSALVGQVLEQLLLIFWGAGANGKTTLLKALSRVLGDDYVRHAAMTTFLAKHQDGIPNDLAALAGARLVMANESGNGRRLDEATVKSLTGGDRITARFLHAEFFTFEPTFTVILSTNHRPEIRGTDHAIWRRVRLVPFTVTIPVDKQDRTLLDRVLMPEAAGILAWLVQGCRRWQREGLGADPTAVSAATEQYRIDSDVIGPFLDDRCEVTPGHRTPFELSGTLYDAYRQYCQATGETHPISKTDFVSRLADKGLIPGKEGGARVWRGIALVGGGS